MFSNQQTKFTNIAHNTIMKIGFYNKILPRNNIDIHSTNVLHEGYDEESRILDIKYGVDYRIIVHNLRLGDIPITIQERFRDIKYYNHQDLTIRLETKNGKSSELSKINADLFIYGYYDINNKKFEEIFVIDMVLVKLGLARQTLEFTIRKNKGKDSKFIAIKFDDLIDIKAILYTYKNNKLNKIS